MSKGYRLQLDAFKLVGVFRNNGITQNKAYSTKMSDLNHVSCSIETLTREGKEKFTVRTKPRNTLSQELSSVGSRCLACLRLSRRLDCSDWGCPWTSWNLPYGWCVYKKTIGSEERKLSVVKYIQFSAQCSTMQPSRANATECSIMAVGFAAK